jgi:hypothetical protein
MAEPQRRAAAPEASRGGRGGSRRRGGSALPGGCVRVDVSRDTMRERGVLVGSGLTGPGTPTWSVASKLNK